ncbi:OSBP(oxysterol binding protein)-related protein2A [Striga asiatica]|uniref:OSBP(Oxysterol binding protein)-related protein2A n=1 Tax=Striga asiatica TaxID=4170 RepID=A0A5A7QQQ3_STRAF|nr:OSBP(oxysterol binding protein)-related protein2A [Striga asiatica]
MDVVNPRSEATAVTTTHLPPPESTRLRHHNYRLVLCHLTPTAVGLRPQPVSAGNRPPTVASLHPKPASDRSLPPPFAVNTAPSPRAMEVASYDGDLPRLYCGGAGRHLWQRRRLTRLRCRPEPSRRVAARPTWPGN